MATDTLDLTTILAKHPGFNPDAMINIKKLPPINLPDGPTWNDRIKRAEKIKETVGKALARAQEEQEEHFLDLRESLLDKIRQIILPGGRIEGTKLIFPRGDPAFTSSINIIQDNIGITGNNLI
jgi:hypothetical protein